MISSGLLFIIAALHLYFLALEMYFWTKPLGLKIFRQSQQQAEASKVLAANQGLYNGFLAAGLIWAALEPDPKKAVSLAIFFLGCVTIAGAYGGWTVGKKIFFIQSVPAILNLVLLFWETAA